MAKSLEKLCRLTTVLDHSGSAKRACGGSSVSRKDR
jgi:hypothetical protein